MFKLVVLWPVFYDELPIYLLMYILMYLFVFSFLIVHLFLSYQSVYLFYLFVCLETSTLNECLMTTQSCGVFCSLSRTRYLPTSPQH